VNLKKKGAGARPCSGVISLGLGMSRVALLRVALAAIVLATCRIPLPAQFNTPSIKGVIQPGEYGNTQNRTNQIGTKAT
jgi:hypothetical protein